MKRIPVFAGIHHLGSGISIRKLDPEKSDFREGGNPSTDFPAFRNPILGESGRVRSQAAPNDRMHGGFMFE